MKILHCKVENFGSYPELEVDFETQGLTLVHGKTGAGKSTIMDAVAWCLYGVTAKGGSVDEVKSWKSNGDTIGEIRIQRDSTIFNVVRKRGKTNDLYFFKDGMDTQIRGKNLQDTQSLIDFALGVDSTTYSTAAYFHEFSPTQSFFVAKAKDRRELFEKLARLDLPNNLTESASSARKKSKVEHTVKSVEVAKLIGRIESSREELQRTVESVSSWEARKAHKVITLEKEACLFEDNKSEKLLCIKLEIEAFDLNKEKTIDRYITQIEKLDASIRTDKSYEDQLVMLDLTDEGCTICKSCGQEVHNKKQIVEKKARKKEIEDERRVNDKKLMERELAAQILESKMLEANPHHRDLEIEESRVNTYGDQLKSLNKETNPYNTQLEIISTQIESLEKDHTKAKTSLEALDARISALGQLLHLAGELRAELLRNAVQGVQDQANDYLEKYFDSEIRVSLELEADTLEAKLQCRGFDCSYTQLSKGQRGLLKLCFGVAVMKAVANNSGIHFDNLMFDEALDGLDTELKVKAFTLFEQLATEHASIMLIDHAEEFKNKFERKLLVTMENDESRIAENE